MSRDTDQLDPPTLEFTRAYGSPEPTWLAELRESTADHPQGEMQISLEQGQLLGVLTRAVGATRVLEAGTFTGYSSLVFADAVGPRGRVVTVDRDTHIQTGAGTVATRAGLADRIEYLHGDGIAVFDSLLPDHAASFDLAFLDADKQRMVQYCELCARLVRPGGLVLIDNLFRGGKVADPAHADDEGVRAMWAVKAWLEQRSPSQCWQRGVIPISDGIAAFLIPDSKVP